MNILILDTETTGLDPSNGSRLIEVGALLYSVKHKVVVQTLSTFLPTDTNEAENINHIKPEWTMANPCTHSALLFLRDMAKNCFAIVAHNAEFDRRFIRTVIPAEDEFWKKRWICTKANFTWPVRLPRMRLQDICEGMGVMYTGAHRALTDAQFLADCFSRVEDLEVRFERHRKMV